MDNEVAAACSLLTQVQTHLRQTGELWENSYLRRQHTIQNKLISSSKSI